MIKFASLHKKQRFPSLRGWRKAFTFIHHSLGAVWEPEEQVAPDVLPPDALHQVHELAVGHEALEELLLGYSAVAVEVQLLGDVPHQVGDLLVQPEALDLCEIEELQLSDQDLVAGMLNRLQPDCLRSCS